MDSLLPIDISASALQTQRLRLAVIASNLANIQTTRTPEGGPYKRRDVLVTAATTPEFQKTLERQMAAGGSSEATEDEVFEAHLRGVEPTEIVVDQREPLLVHAPWHPDADANGNVKMPNISAIEEMVNMIGVQRAYEANINVMKTTRAMVEQALELGK